MLTRSQQSWTSLLGSLSTADPKLGNSIFSEVDKVFTLLPTQLQTFQKSLGSQVTSIRATWTGTFPDGFLSQSPIASTSGVGAATTKATGSSSTSVTKAAASSTGAAEKVVVVGYAVAMGAVGVAAVLL